MKKYDAIVFDLDGTLLDTLQDLADSVNHALRLYGMSPRTREEIRTFVGNGIAKLIHLAVPAGTEPEREAACLSAFQAHYLTNMENKTAPYPGVAALLERLKTGGYGVAVVSNKFDGAVKGLCATYFGDCVPVAIGESVGVARKPAPDMLLRALTVLETVPERAVYVGDSDVDLLTAQNAGLSCVSVTWGFRARSCLEECGATLLVDTIEELAQALEL